MIIRKAEAKDINTLAKMNKHLIEDEKHPNPMNLPQLTQRMEQWLQNEYVSYLASINNKAVAYCLYRDDGEFYYLRQLFVEHGWRRRGIATELLDWMYTNIWKHKKVRLDVLVHNKEAIAFYEKYGFKVGCLRMEKQK